MESCTTKRRFRSRSLKSLLSSLEEISHKVIITSVASSSSSSSCHDDHEKERSARAGGEGETRELKYTCTLARGR